MDLEVVVVKTDDIRVRETGDFTCGTADTASDVEDAHTGFEVHLCGEVVLVTGESGSEGLTRVETTEVEGLRPTVFVELCCTVVVPIHNVCVALETVLVVGICLFFEILVPEGGVVLDSASYTAVCKLVGRHLEGGK